MKKALLTGVTGFIGQNLIKRLIDENWQIDVIVRPTSDVRTLAAWRESIRIFVHGKDNELLDIVAESKPDVVFHLAALYLATHKYKDIAPLIQSNISFGTQLLEAMAQNQVRNFVNVSTYWQNYQNKPYNPVNLYSATKQAFIDISRYYQETAELKMIDLRLFDTYGSNDPRKKILSLLKECGESGQTLVMSPGAQLIDLVHIDDVTEAFALAGDYLRTGNYDKCGTYAVSSGNQVTLRELAQTFARISGLKINIVWGGRPYRQREVMMPWNTGRTLPGWKCSITLEDGIKRILKLIDNNKE